MNKIERFEDFIAWQKARSLTARIYKVTGEGNFARDFGLKDQIRRAAVSIMSNMLSALNEGVLRNSISSSQSPKDLAQRFGPSSMSRLTPDI